MDPTLEGIQGIIEFYWLKFLEGLPVALSAGGIILVFWILARYATKWLIRALERTNVDDHFQRVASRFTRYTILGMGFVTALGTVGVQLSALVTTLGVVGFAVSFAFQDIIGNFLAGLLIMFQRPFKLGDAINSAGVDGIVEDIRIRDTVLKTFDGKRVVMPNRSILNDSILNYSANTVRRFDVAVGISYSDDIGKAIQVCHGLLPEIEGVVDDPEPMVIATSFGDSSINLEVRFWADTTVRSFLLMRSDVVQAIKRRFDEEGITIPFPIRTIYTAKD